MLSYRHAFHAGNHADVLKHVVLMQLLDYMGNKDKPFWYIDTHAGAGYYALDTGYATKNAEYESGIARLWQREDLPASLAEYVAAVREFNKDGELRCYPGSPGFALPLLRETDRMRLFEKHPTDSQALLMNFRTAGRKVAVQVGDGFAGLKAMLPPPPKRAVVLIDPPYEEKHDYQLVLEAIKDGQKRFATGTYAIWYPQLTRSDSELLPTRFKALGLASWLHVSLSITNPTQRGFGMYGSGMLIVNPPWTLPKTLAEVMPFLVNVLGEDAGASYCLEHQIP